MKLRTYKEYLKLAKDGIDTLQLPFKVKKAEKALELKIVELESSIATKEVAIQELLTDKDELKWDNIIDAIDDKELEERKLGQLNDLKDQLFA